MRDKKTIKTFEEAKKEGLINHFPFLWRAKCLGCGVQILLTEQSKDYYPTNAYCISCLDKKGLYNYNMKK